MDHHYAPEGHHYTKGGGHEDDGGGMDAYGNFQHHDPHMQFGLEQHHEMQAAHHDMHHQGAGGGQYHLSSASAGGMMGHDDDGFKKPKRRALKKAPNAPKRGKSAYILFSVDKRPEVKAMLPPDAKVTEVMKKIAELWRELDPESKKFWEQKAVEDKARYMDELSTYEGPLRIPNKRKKKDPNAPKRAMSAFLHFSQTMRPKLKEDWPHAKNVDISKLLGEAWGKLPQEEKEPFIARANEDNRRYKEDMVRFKSEKPDTAATQEAGADY